MMFRGWLTNWLLIGVIAFDLYLLIQNYLYGPLLVNEPYIILLLLEIIGLTASAIFAITNLINIGSEVRKTRKEGKNDHRN